MVTRPTVSGTGTASFPSQRPMEGLSPQSSGHASAAAAALAHGDYRNYASESAKVRVAGRHIGCIVTVCRPVEHG